MKLRACHAMGSRLRSALGLTVIAAWGAAALFACAGPDPVAERAKLDSGEPRTSVDANVDAGTDASVRVPLAELGRHLFYDKRLSFNETTSCASCHEQSKAFSDGKATPKGATGQILSRNSQTLFNLEERATYTWGNPTLTTLERQANVPIFADIVIELGATGHERTILQRIAVDPTYERLFRAAFGTGVELATFPQITSAIAEFERTLISRESPYDRFLAGDATALDESAKRGRELFFSETCECYHCHDGRDLTSSIRTATGAYRGSFANTGLYDVDGRGSYPSENTGLFEITENPSDMGKFRVPSLRNVEVSAPYMHDGTIASLEDVIAHYARGGRLVTGGPTAGDGAKSRLKDPLVRGFTLSDTDTAALVAFLRSLTDAAFLRDPRHANPWPSDRTDASADAIGRDGAADVVEVDAQPDGGTLDASDSNPP